MSAQRIVSLISLVAGTTGLSLTQRHIDRQASPREVVFCEMGRHATI